MITDAWRAYFQYVLRTGPIRARATFYEHDDLPIWPVTCWQSQRSWGCCCHMGMGSTVMAWLSVLLQWFMSFYHQSTMEMIHDDSRVPLTSDHTVTKSPPKHHHFLVWCHPLLWICLMEQRNGPNFFCCHPCDFLYLSINRIVHNWSQKTVKSYPPKLTCRYYIYIYIYHIQLFISWSQNPPTLNL